MRVTVRLFARLREIVGAGTLERDVAEGSTVADVWGALVREFDGLSPYTVTIAAGVNADYARMATPVAENDEIAFLPPVSGGSTSCSKS